MSSYNEMITCMGPGGMFGNFTGVRMTNNEIYLEYSGIWA